MWAGGIIWGGLCPCFRWPCYSTDKNVLTDRHITTRLLTTCVAVPGTKGVSRTIFCHDDTHQNHFLQTNSIADALTVREQHMSKQQKDSPETQVTLQTGLGGGGIGLGFKEMTAFTKIVRNVHVCITELHHFCTSKTFSTDFGLINIRDCDSDENSISCCLDIYRRGHNCGCYNISHIHTQTHTHVQNKMSQQSCKSLDTQSEVKKEIKASTLEGSR